MSRTAAPQRVRVNFGADRGYDITFTELSDLPAIAERAGIRAGRCVVVSDSNVARRYGDAVTESLTEVGYTCQFITLPAGETTKSIDHLQHIYTEALEWEIERGTPLIAVGGGVVGDLAGFAAATLLRGLPLVHVPTTLIAQVDSAIGGKTGINHAAGKNLIGAFHQPRAVLADTTLLQSLPDREWTSGLAEVVKHGLIADAGLFDLLEQSWDDLMRRQQSIVDMVVPRAATAKVNVVAEDERERGLRAILNFGHTFAHAIENVSGYGTFTHGEAVAAGMRAALYMSKQMHPDLDSDRADALVSRIPVPSGLRDLNAAELTDAMRTDKKVRDGRIRFVLLDEIGHAYVRGDIPGKLVTDTWSFLQDVAG